MRKLLVLTSLVAAWAGCTGTVGDGGDETSPPVTTEQAIGVGPMHRLNRVEYRNTVRDLLGTAMDPAANFPADDVSFGFDNVSAVLTTSPLQVELWEQAARELATEALAIPQAASQTRVEAETLTGSVGSVSGEAWNLYSNGEVGDFFELGGEGDYRIRARVWAQQAGPDLAQAAIGVNGQELQTFDVSGDANAPEVIEVTTTLSGGSTQIAVSFLNDFYDANGGGDRNLYVDWIEVEGPLGVSGSNPTREQIVTCDPSEVTCRETIFRNFAGSAWRRPVTDDEVATLEGLVQGAIQEGGDVEAGLVVAFTGVLLSPNFVFRPELDADPNSLVPHPLTDHELASRLSYFLWSSMPDAELAAAADAGNLHEPEVLSAQVDRMLADPKSAALVDNFAGQWLLIRALEDHVPFYEAFPEYDDTLRESLRQELELFFGEFLKGEVGLDQLLTADFTFLNQRLADHYGLPFDGGAEMEKVTVPAERRGLLSKGALLTVTSYPDRTSPVKRGVWVLEQLLCTEPPPPPPGVEALEPEETPTQSLRERLEQHRADPACASCHNLMDPIGLGLENYDGIGRWRTQDAEGFAIDAQSELYTGEAFDGGAELSAILTQDDRLHHCLAEKLFIYGLGRDVQSEDEHHLEAMLDGYAEEGYRLPDLIKRLVTSQPFLTRRGVKEAQ